MTWAVVKFTKEDAVEAVPMSWFISTSQECFWPPIKDYKREKIFRLIEQKASPLSDWKVYPAVLLGSYDEFGMAQKKAKKAMVTTDLSSSSDGFRGRGSRKRRRNSKYHHESSSENSDDAQDSSDNNTYPSYPIYKKKTLESSQIFPENKEFRHSAVPNLMDESRECHIGTRERTETETISTLHARRQSTSIADERRENTPTLLNSTEVEGEDLQRPTFSQRTRLFSGSTSNSWQTPRGSKFCGNALSEPCVNVSEVTNIRNGNVPNDDDFKKFVMDELSQINLKINTLIDNVGTLIKTRRLEVDVELHSLESSIKTLYDKIPIKSEEELMDIEEWINDDKNKKVMVSELARIGGNSLGQKVRKIMYRILTDDVALTFSWDGAKSKKAFKNLKVARVVLDAIKFQDRESTENEIIDVIKYWLVKAKERLTRKDKMNNTN